jgi:hypothetical protein
VSSIDTMNRTQSNPAYTVVKAGPSLPNVAVGSNCVLTTAGVATLIAAGAGATVPFACGGPQVFQAFLQTPAAAGGAGLPAGTAAFLANATGLYTYGAGYTIEGKAADLSGNQLPNSPHWTTSVGAQYTWDFSRRLVGHPARRLLPPEQAVHPRLQHRLRPAEVVGQRQHHPEGREAGVGPADRRLRQEPGRQDADHRRLHHRRQLGPVHQPDHPGAAHLRRQPDQVVLGRRFISGPREGRRSDPPPFSRPDAEHENARPSRGGRPV